MSNPQTKGGQAASDEELKGMARMFKALSNPHRLRIYRELASCVSGSVTRSPEEFKNCQRGFAERLGLAPSTVSHHFKELRAAGLIHMKREARTVSFWVDREAALMLSHLFNR
ncbi:ArsR/SmtB family transcription factor [Pseudodesulfovibrio indicus]|uniref:ArsR family transcriptional regulator n=1 Tax=Pseudodesulfovibrio indicus TaxID=1716143 RepID=A0A140D9I5_9BACT|nr:metalloregulator ArsR/SmtB family transcription factor [Pseudodesulfovibrio indicus]AMK09852.1 ArsR family transcriptional regulator [Pseudodesulfovibrio indicus]TDT87470.1 ArsR family transcriptional regulator [Pseudodesulfovibrio indicus]